MLMKIHSIALPLIITLFTIGSCNPKDATVRKIPLRSQQSKKVSKLESPANGTKITLGEQIPVTISFHDTLHLDSALVFFRGQPAGKFIGKESTIIETEGAHPGKAGLRLKLYFDNGTNETHSIQITLNSDIVPVQYRYHLVNTFPHDIGAYTQGLEYHEGWLYEGTGNKNQSTVRKVRLENGEVIHIRNNASEIFGEGITIFNGHIYQLTYRSQVCFIYDLNTLEEIQKSYYQNKEGWGLTHNETELIMSDGTHIIYFIDPEMFTNNRQIEVFDNNGPVRDLNELEFIKGKIYANRYYTDEIVIIDPANGKVEGRIDLKRILPVRDRKSSTNVLNGIAWDEETDRLFVTGKYWPKLFEIKIQEVAAGQ